jgi:hypothetical protein
MEESDVKKKSIMIMGHSLPLEKTKSLVIVTLKFDSFAVVIIVTIPISLL